jgi:hypothetical protein
VVAGFIVTLAVFTSEVGLAQKNNSESLIARLSYRSTYAWERDESSPKVCLAAYRDGYYQLLRMTSNGAQTLQGTMSRGQIFQLTELLKNLDFKSRNDGIVRSGSESLIVQVHRQGETRYQAWVDADHRHPFSPSVADVVDWLQNFTPEDPHPLALRELSDQPPICPVSGKGIQPLTVGLRP